MGISLRSAIIISVIIHAALITPFYNHHLMGHGIARRNSVVVDYIVLKDMTTAAAANNRGFVLSTSTAPRADTQKGLAIKPEPFSRGKGEFKKKLETRKSGKGEGFRSAAAIRDGSGGAAAKESELKSSKDYVNYYEFIKERIRLRLKDNYRYYKREGEVCLTFTLASNGALLAYEIDRLKSTQDEVLLHIAQASLKAVSPFPPIPKSLPAPKMSFSIIISFKK